MSVEEIKKDKNNRIIWYDLETTGFNPYHNNIIEIAAIDNFGNDFNVLINIEERLPNKIIEITNITDDMLKEQGINTCDAFKKFKSFLNLEDKKYKNNIYLVAHNNDGFDILFLKYQFYKYEINYNFDKFKYIDTFRLAQLVLPKLYSHSLKTLTTYFKYKNENAHRAMSDVRALQHIFYPLIRYSIKNLIDINNLDDIIKNIYAPITNK